MTLLSPAYLALVFYMVIIHKEGPQGRPLGGHVWKGVKSYSKWFGLEKVSDLIGWLSVTAWPEGGARTYRTKVRFFLAFSHSELFLCAKVI